MGRQIFMSSDKPIIKKQFSVAGSSPAALSFAEFKEALGPVAKKYTDLQIEKMWRICDRFADAFFDTWLREKNTHNVSNGNE